MRMIDYVREEFHAPDEARRAPLPTFLLDVPYLLVLGVVPPLPVLNELLTLGHMGGGMSPGARWSPFVLSAAEYHAALALLPEAARAAARDGSARFVPARIRIDPELAGHPDFAAWSAAVGAKYRRRQG